MRGTFYGFSTPAAWFHSHAAALRFAAAAGFTNPAFVQSRITTRENPGEGIMDTPERPWRKPDHPEARVLIPGHPLTHQNAPLCPLCCLPFTAGDVIRLVPLTDDDEVGTVPAAAVHHDCASVNAR